MEKKSVKIRKEILALATLFSPIISKIAAFENYLTFNIKEGKIICTYLPIR